MLEKPMQVAIYSGPCQLQSSGRGLSGKILAQVHARGLWVYLTYVHVGFHHSLQSVQPVRMGRHVWHAHVCRFMTCGMLEVQFKEKKSLQHAGSG